MIITINGIDWLMVFVESNDYRLLMPNGWTIGVTDLNNKTICIANNLSDDMLQKVIMHELTHALLASYGFAPELRCEELMCQIVEEYSDDIMFLADKIYENL